MLKKIDFSRHKFECLQIQTDSPQLLIRRSGEREGRKRARSSGSGGPNLQPVSYTHLDVYKRQPYIKPLLEYATDCCAEIANMYCENGCDLIQTCDPCSSGDMISPKMYEQHVVPTLEGLTSQLKNCETFLLHICGKAGMRLPHVKALGIDGFSVDSPVDLKESLEAAGKELTMVGNFNPNELLCMGTSEAVYAAAYANAEIAGLDGGYVMMPGCDLAARTPLENILAMVRASSDYAASVRN